MFRRNHLHVPRHRLAITGPPVRLDLVTTLLFALLPSVGTEQPVAAQSATETKKIEFATQVRPILEQNCLSCHSPDEAQGGLNLATLQAAMVGGDSGDPSIVPNKADESPLYLTTIADADSGEMMPPEDAGGPLGDSDTETIRAWIFQGATWPKEITLVAKERVEKVVPGQIRPDNMQLVKKIHAKITAESHDTSASSMKNYTGTVPRSEATFQMIAIAGGEFDMGSPSSEVNRKPNEGPQVRVKIKPFWMGRCEVTWDEYEPFMVNGEARAKDGTLEDYDPTKHTIVDAVTCPTPPYMEMSFGMGQMGYPAISMTQHAANKYCQWLSAQTGHFYRLPTEAEWEYACRAGTTTAYSFGDDPAQLGEYAWYYENANEKYQKVGTKKANPWGLHDMHGNVMEWTADQYDENYFQTIAAAGESPFLTPIVTPFSKPTTLYPRSVRGGGWDDDAEQLRSAFRRGSQADWKVQDPQLPKSIWYHTDAQWLGFRIVRPLEVPSVDEMNFYWNSAAKKKR